MTAEDIMIRRRWFALPQTDGTWTVFKVVLEPSPGVPWDVCMVTGNMCPFVGGTPGEALREADDWFREHSDTRDLPQTPEQRIVELETCIAGLRGPMLEPEPQTDAEEVAENAAQIAEWQKEIAELRSSH